MRSFRVLLLLIVLALVTAACEAPAELQTIPPPVSMPPTTVTVPPMDYSGVALPQAAGATTTTLAIIPGGATLTGRVTGPDGPVEGAIVRAERLVGDAVASIDGLTRADGGFTIAGIKGGRFRVRAWRAPELALVSPEVFYLGGNESRRVDLTVTRYDGLAVAANMAPSPALTQRPANLVVQVSRREVDGNGIVRNNPVPATRIELYGPGEWRIDTANPTTTDAAGRGRWTVTCRSTGIQPLGVVIADSMTYPIDVPTCTPPPPPSTAPPTSPPVTPSTAPRTTPSTAPSTTARSPA